MKLKAVRASMVAALMATLSASLFPPTQSYAGASQSQQEASARARRGKNGAAPSSATSQEQLSTQSSKATPAGSTESPPAPNNQWPAGERRLASEQESAPPFDRPPIRSQQRPGDATTQPAPQPPVYSGNDPTERSRNRSDSSGSRERASESGGVVGPEGSARSGGPPVLRRPSDARPRDEDRAGGAAGPSNQPAGNDDVIKLESTLVNISLLVSDRSGRYVPQLSARDFVVYEDGARQTIASFGSEEVPFNVVLLLDVSPSVQGSIEDIQDAAIAFVRQLRDRDRVMVVSFDRNIHYLSDFTSDRRQLEWAIRRAHTGSGTSVYDAVYEAVDRKLRGVEGRKALILFSDGEDTTSGQASYDDAVDLVSESDVLVYGLRYPGSGGGNVQVDPWPRTIPRLPLPFPWPWPTPRRRRGPFTFLNWAGAGNSITTTSAAGQSWPRRRGGGGDFMADITAAGGGPVYDAEQIGDLSRLAYRIAEELRHVYVISYYPTNPLSNGGYRSVRVSVPTRTDLAVRHRKGYNARPTEGVKSTI